MKKLVIKMLVVLQIFTVQLSMLGCVSKKAIQENLEQPYEDVNNTYCPVMEDRKVTGEHFWVYDGKRYGLCCDACLWVFKRNPEKYTD